MPIIAVTLIFLIAATLALLLVRSLERSSVTTLVGLIQSQGVSVIPGVGLAGIMRQIKAIVTQLDEPDSASAKRTRPDCSPKSPPQSPTTSRRLVLRMFCYLAAKLGENLVAGNSRLGCCQTLSSERTRGSTLIAS